MGSDALNARMGELVPECTSTWAHYPMKRDAWTSARGTAPDGQPAFVPHPNNPGEKKPLKKDYVWGPGSCGFGYYHLTTKESYKILAARLQSEAAPTCCCSFGAKGKEQEQLKELHILMHCRAESPIPDDKYAYTHAVQAAGAAFRAPDDFGLWEYNLGGSPNKPRNQQGGR